MEHQEQCQNFATKGFTGTCIHVFLPSFVEIGKAEVAKQVRGVHHEKKVVLCPFHCGFWGDLAKKIYRITTLSPFPIALSSFVQNRAVFDEIGLHPKMSARLITISA